MQILWGKKVCYLESNINKILASNILIVQSQRFNIFILATNSPVASGCLPTPFRVEFAAFVCCTGWAFLLNSCFKICICYLCSTVASRHVFTICDFPHWLIIIGKARQILYYYICCCCSRSYRLSTYHRENQFFVIVLYKYFVYYDVVFLY